MSMSKKMHHYTECGLDDVYLANGYEWISSPRGKSLKIEDVEGLHIVIGMQIIDEKKALTGPEVRFLRHELCLTQNTLGQIIGVDAQTVARWEKGESDKVPPAADRLVRLLYREKATGNADIAESLNRIVELDEQIGDQLDRMVFESHRKEGWRPQIAA